MTYPALRGSSPWGSIDGISPLGPDACSVSTPSHGGIWVSPEANARIPAAFRAASGWYEEDCDYAIPFAFLGLHNSEAQRENALESLRHWNPDAYEAHTGRKLAPGESRKRDEATFYAENAGRWIVTGAYGDWAHWVPDGKVGVGALIGGHRAPSHFSPAPVTKWFLIDKAEYQARGPFGFVIDEARHCEIMPPENPGRSKERAA